WNLQQVQAFIPTPMTLATAMYWTGIDPMTKTPLFVAKDWKDRKIQQALLQPHKPEHREIMRQYNQDRRLREVAGGRKRDFGTNDPRTPVALRNRKKKQRSIVEPPTEKMGKKLLLDSR